jgi:hypothetical protein
LDQPAEGGFVAVRDKAVEQFSVADDPNGFRFVVPTAESQFGANSCLNHRPGTPGEPPAAFASPHTTAFSSEEARIGQDRGSINSSDSDTS